MLKSKYSHIHNLNISTQIDFDMKTFLFCALCHKFILYASRNGLVCFDDENMSQIYAKKTYVYKQNLKFVERYIHCKNCDLKLGINSDRYNYVILFRYRLMRIRKTTYNNLEYNRSYNLPVIGEVFMNQCYGLAL